MASGTVQERRAWEEQTDEEAWVRAEIVRAVSEANRGMRSGAFPCRCCGTFKSRPSAECSKCGDMEGSYNGNPHDIDRAHGYAFTEGPAPIQRSEGRQVKGPKRIEPSAKPSTARQVAATLEKRAKVERDLTRQLRSLPPGDERRAAIRACLNAGISQTELALLLDVSRQRVNQLVRDADEIPF